MNIDRIWADEGERRIDAYLRGDAKARDAKPDHWRALTTEK
jgi:hypothetical protein